MRLIDADVLRARLEGMMKAPWNAQSAPYCWAHAYEAMLEELENAPTVGAEPVVRCKDCKFYPDGEGTTKWTPCCDMITPPNWYCADGERRKDDASGTN